MSSFHLQIAPPDGLIFDGQAERLLCRTIAGDVCILARHADYVTALGMGEARLSVDGNVRRAACMGGMLTVVMGEAHLVPTTFEWAEDIDAERAQRAKERAEMQIREKKADKRDLMLAEARLKRALVRMQVKG